MANIKGFWSHLSVSRKLTAILTSVVLILALVAGTLLVTAATALSRDVYLPSNLHAIHNLLTTPAITKALHSSPKIAEEILRAATRYPLVAVIGLYKTDGSLYAGYSHSSSDAVPVSLTAAQQKQHQNDALLKPVTIIPQAPLWQLYISATSTLPTVFYERMVIAVLLLFGCFAWLAMISIQLIRHNITHPVHHLTRVAKSITREGSYTLRAKKQNQDELGGLADSFNHMLDHIEAHEQQLTSIKAYLNAIIDSMPSAIVAVDHQYQITRWSQEATNLTDISRNTALQQPLQKILPFISACIPAIDEAFSDHAIHREEKVSATLLGERLYLDIIIYPMSGEADNDVVIRMDNVTHRLKMEEIMVQLEKMMSVGGLAAGMAHEINNPLGAIIQGVQTIQRRLSLELDANMKQAKSLDLDLAVVNQYLQKRGINRFLANIQDAGIRASGIVANMLQFSRSNDRQLLPCNLNELIGRTLEIAKTDFELRPELNFHQLEIQCSLTDNLPLVECIHSEIQQVLLNLLKNAAQAVQAHFASADEHYHGVITISTHQEGDKAVIKVRDNGAGMDEDVRKRIFEPFFTTKDIGAGTGLGLSVSYFIMTNNHKGTMTASTQPGKGSCFTLRLPLKRP